MAMFYDNVSNDYFRIKFLRYVYSNNFRLSINLRTLHLFFLDLTSFWLAAIQSRSGLVEYLIVTKFGVLSSFI